MSLGVDNRGPSGDALRSDHPTKGPCLRVRDATPNDVPFIVSANQRMAEETEGRALDRVTLEAGVRAVFSDPQRGFYLIAEVDGEAAATLLLTTEWSDWRNGPIWWIQSVYVVPDRRGSGLYRRMHEAVVERAVAAANVRELRLYVDQDNTDAQQVYRKLGMRISRYDIFEQEIPPAGPSGT